ncbi:alginate lyase family protein [Arachidicoccus terrestris]|uniref:alginate lyase family protein n=1 Tax=Arachidicoccus terrestris TaxID=2875539 RepID=UPI001CC45DAB|nr:alginate lyase family protein [Arachidicoccus terrestris]UAY56043.1 alginate lyase family protein [Arachidicoccus terrestris]
MKKYSLIIIASVSLTMMTACSKGVNQKNGDPTTNPDSTNTAPTVSKIDTLPTNTPFKHPGLLLSQKDFDRIKTKVNASASPWIEGWNKLITNTHAQTNYTPNPVDTLIRGGSSREQPKPDNYSRAFNDVAAAFQLAVRWKITGDDSYAEAAIKILNAWAAKCKAISGDSNTALAGGIYGYQFANAGEILRDYSGWKQEDFEAFKQFMLNVFYANNHAFLSTHWGTCSSHYWANWDFCALASEMAIGVLTDKRELYNHAIYYLQNGIGTGNINNAINYVYGDSLAQWQESGRDQGHCTLDVALFGTICQQAWNQGDDLYGLDNNRFLKACEYVAKYNVASLEVPYTAYTNCEGVSNPVISSNGRGTVRPMWELVYNHYVNLKGLKATWTTLGAKSVRPEGGGGDYGPNSGGYDQFGFGTLLYSR